MGSFQSVPGIRDEKYPSSYIEAIQLFSKSVIGAEEIDAVDLEKAKEERKFSMFFYIANITIDRLLDDIREQLPSKCPVLRVYGEEKKESKKRVKKDGYNRERME